MSPPKKMTKSGADYEKASVKGKNCGTCAYMLPDGLCRRVFGHVTRTMVCRLYKKS